jgi:hypothetical protein
MGLSETVRGINIYLKGTELTQESSSALAYVSRLSGTTFGGGGAALGVYKAGEAFLCSDYLCLGLSCVVADVLVAATSFIPGVTATSMATIPLSSFCKVLAYNCKHGNLFKHCGGN